MFVRSLPLFLLVVSALGCGSTSQADGDAGPGAIDASSAAECSGPEDCAGEFEICVAGDCIPGTCEDNLVTGNESDIDCGGECQPCAEGQACLVADDCVSAYCDSAESAAVCRDCSTSADCEAAGDAYCSGGICAPRRSQGESCASADQCSTGFCVEGVCCDGPCDGTCETCSTSGVCTLVAAGQPSGGDCNAAGDCGQTGLCDGSGGCQLAANGTSCATESCAGGGTGTCNGSGVCVGGAGSCNPYTCNTGIDDCYTSCPSAGNRAECATGFYCNGSTCVAKKSGSNQTCSQGYECSTGFCVDGYCCNNACSGTCRACSAALTGGTNGTCANTLTSAGTQPECPAEAGSSCGRTGLCSGGACQLHSGTSCAGQTCTGTGTLTPAKTCNGAGSCTGPASSSCSGNLQCLDGTSCRSSCTLNSHCQPGYLCRNGSCRAQGSWTATGFSENCGDLCVSSCSSCPAVQPQCNASPPTSTCAVGDDCYVWSGSWASGYTCQ